MQRALINLLPSWAIISGSILITSIAISIIFFLIRRYVPVEARKNENFFTTILGITSGSYGFFLGFVVVVLWQAFNDARMVTTAEANHLALILWDSQILPESTRNEVLAGVQKYIHLLKEKEWPAMREGESDPNSFRALQELFATMQKYSPTTEAEKIFYSNIVSNINLVVQKRRERLRAMESLLTDPLRFILVIGMFVIGFLLSFIYNPNPIMQLMAILILCGMIAFHIGIIVILDYPFSGGVAVSIKPFSEGTLEQFIK